MTTAVAQKPKRGRPPRSTNKKAATTTAKNLGTPTITLKPTMLKYIAVAIEGTASMIYDAIPTKDVVDIYKKYIKPKLLKEKKSLDPIQDLMIKIHWTNDGRMSIPCRNIKYAMVACLDLFGKVGIPKTRFKRVIDVRGFEESDKIPIESNIKDLELRMDAGKNKMGNAIGMVRPEVMNWKAYFLVGFVSEMFTPESIYNLINTAGTYNGLMALRAERTCDNHGSFKVIACPTGAKMKSVKSITMGDVKDLFVKKLKDQFGIHKFGSEWVV